MRTLRRIWPFLLVLAVAAVLAGVAYRRPLKQLARHMKAKWRSLRAEKSLWYEVTPILSLSKPEFDTFVRRAAPAPVYLGLDDPFLVDYQVLRIRLWNEGRSITQPPQFRLSAGSRLIKVLDITGHSRRAGGTSLRISHNIPRLRWRTPWAGEARLRLGWDGPRQGAAGYHIYQSRVMQAGFGRINSSLVTGTDFALPMGRAEDAQWRFFRVGTVAVGGGQSELSETLALRDVIGFCATFENTLRIRPRASGSARSRGTNSLEVETPAEALRQPMRYDAVIVNTAQESETRRLLERGGVRVFTDEDLEFMQGSIRFSLPEGLAAGAEIELQVYLKAAPGVPIVPSLETDAASPVVLRRKGSSPRLAVNEPPSMDSAEARLTPPVVRSVASSHSILLLWDAPAAADYAGVTLYRSGPGDESGPQLQPMEIYRGRGSTNQVVLSWKREETADVSGAGSDQAGKTNLEEVLDGMSFEDTSVPDDRFYWYTLIAYDRAGHRAHPITLQASLRDRTAGAMTWRRAD